MYDTAPRPWGVAQQHCRWCGTDQPVGEFWRNPVSGWITHECRTCAGQRLRRWAEVEAKPVVVGRRYVDSSEGDLLCTRCGQSLPRAAFYTFCDRKSGRRYYRPKCRQCTHAEQNRTKPGRDRSASSRRADRERWLRTKYGIGLEEYDALFTRQDGRCAICRSDQPGGPTPSSAFHVDHDHGTGRVRGLLCRACNTAIGLLAEDPDRVRAAEVYLRE